MTNRHPDTSFCGSISLATLERKHPANGLAI